MAAALVGVMLAAVVCRSQLHPSNMPPVDVLKPSGLAEAEGLANEFRRSADTNALAQLCAMAADPGRKATCAGLLGSLSPYLTSTQVETFVIPALVRGLTNPSAGVRRDCAMVLSEYFARFAKPAIPAFMRLLPGGPEDTLNASIYAAEALGKIGPEAAEAVPNLVKVLDQPESQPSGYEDLSVRVRAVEAIGLIGFKTQSVWERVQKALSDVNPYVRAKSAQALLRSDKSCPQAVVTVAELMQSRDAAVRRFTLRALEALHSIPDPLRIALSSLKPDSDPEVQAGLHNLLNASRQ